MSEELKAALARIAELEGALSWHEEQRNDMAEIRAELAAIKAQEPVAWAGAIEYGVPLLMVEPQNWKATPLYAAPVSEAKAQVVIPPSPYMPGSQPTDFTDYELGEIHGRIAMWEEVKRLNAAPAAPAADAWIPVSERLPEVESRLDQECRAGTLSVAPLNVSAAVLVFDGEKVRSTRLEWFDGCLPLPYCITHWMPLPSGPAAHSAQGVV